MILNATMHKTVAIPYIGACVHFNISCNIFIPQLCGEVPKKNLPFLGANGREDLFVRAMQATQILVLQSEKISWNCALPHWHSLWQQLNIIQSRDSSNFK